MSLDIVGVVPAAGVGSRIAPLPGSKELLPVGMATSEIAGELRHYPKVISHYLIEQMCQASASRLFMTISPPKTDLLHYYRSGAAFSVPIAYLIQEEPWGMPYALDLAHPYLSPNTLTVFGMPDTLFAPPDLLAQLVAHQQRTGVDLVLALFPTDTPHLFGMVDIDSQGQVLNIVDKPQHSDLRYLWGAACWTYRFSTFMHEVLPATRPEREIVLGDIFLAASKQMRVSALPFDDGVYLDIGSPEGLQRTLDYCRHESGSQRSSQVLQREIEGNTP